MQHTELRLPHVWLQFESQQTVVHVMLTCLYVSRQTWTDSIMCLDLAQCAQQALVMAMQPVAAIFHKMHSMGFGCTSKQNPLTQAQQFTSFPVQSKS